MSALDLDKGSVRRARFGRGRADHVALTFDDGPDPLSTPFFLRALDVFVFPSLAESFGLAPVEAAQAGVSVVANDGRDTTLQAEARKFAKLLHSLPDYLRGLDRIELNIEALSDANVAGHAVSAVDAATWHPPGHALAPD